VKSHHDRGSEEAWHTVLEGLPDNELSVDLARERLQHGPGSKDLAPINHRLGLSRRVTHDPLQDLWNIATSVVYEDQIIALRNTVETIGRYDRKGIRY
jgi:hypothetical protein